MPPDRATPTPATRRAPSIRIAFQTLGRTVRHGYENAGTLAIGGLLWIVSFFLVLPLGPTTAALHRLTRPMSEERAVNWRSFFTHLRADARWSSVLFFTLAIAGFVLQANIGFYAAAPSQAVRFVAAVFGAMLFVWAGIALYAFPLALRQADQRLRLTLRNALVMSLANFPGLLVSLVLLIGLSALLLLLPPLFVMIPGAVALWGQENARLLLVASGHLPKDPIADEGDDNLYLDPGNSRARGRK